MSTICAYVTLSSVWGEIDDEQFIEEFHKRFPNLETFADKYLNFCPEDIESTIASLSELFHTFGFKIIPLSDGEDNEAA